ncbi:hypothetical protein QFC22_005733 [Naganishia vaughanmartiniae]|uniref:Uncharacterized protein n=1 Tax=Naganishia vaughanmartiniae TaxID=1424756 RepID=A0ACC2WU02_9TREE|nr:hypothetical protein QFC22_005733 [Naganishia vaughanmartiniae]
MSRFHPHMQHHSRRTGSAARMKMRHVIDMTQVDAVEEDEASDVGDSSAEVSGNETVESEKEKKMQVIQEEGELEEEEEEEEPERQVLPGDLLHALATLETFRRMADAGIDDEWGIGAGTVRQMAYFNSVGAAGKLSRRGNPNGCHRDAQQQNGNGGDGVAADIEVNLDGRVPTRAKFSRGEAMYDVSPPAPALPVDYKMPNTVSHDSSPSPQIPIEPLAEWLSFLTDPDHLEKVKYILENAATPYDYFRIDERINEAYQQHEISHDIILTGNTYAPWQSAVARRSAAETDVPNVPIVRELRIDITTLHPSAIYRLEQLRRRQLKQRVLPMRMDVWVEEKEFEWARQRTKEKRAAQRLEREKERQRLQAEEEKERKRLAEEKRKQQEETVRRHLGLSLTTSHRDRRNDEQDHSDRSSEMSPVPSNISSPSPPPPQIFHEVQESVPFPFTPSSPTVTSSQPVIPTSTRPTPASPTPRPRSAKFAEKTNTPSGVIDLTAVDGPIPVPRRIKFKFKGASSSLSNSNQQRPVASTIKSPAIDVGQGSSSQQFTPKAAVLSSFTSIAEGAPVSSLSHTNANDWDLPNGATRRRRPPPILSHASLVESGIASGSSARVDVTSTRTERDKGGLFPVSAQDSSLRRGTPVEEEVPAQQDSPRGISTTSSRKHRDSQRSTSTKQVVEKLGIMLTDQQAAETSAGRHNDNANKVVIDLTLALDGDEVDAVRPISNCIFRRNSVVLPSSRARRIVVIPDDSDEPSYVTSSQSQLQDEEDEARVEELDILGEANPDDSPDCAVQVDGVMPGFIEESSRVNKGKVSSSAAARSRQVIIIIDDDDEEEGVDSAPKTTTISSTSSRAAPQSPPHPEPISAEEVLTVNTTPATSMERDTSEKASASDVSKQQDTYADMMVDNELEPVSFEDTRSWQLQQDSQPAEPAALQSPDNNKGPQRTSAHKGKARADQLNLTITTPSNDLAQQGERGEKWATSSKVMQIRGITGPTATDTDTSADTTSANTPLRSPAPVLPLELAAELAPSRLVPVSLVPLSTNVPPTSPAPVERPALSLPLVPIVPSASPASAAPLPATDRADVMSPMPEPSVTVQTVLMPVESQPQSVPISARSALARQRQSEAFYAALASSFLNRCGATPSLPNVYEAGSSSQIRHPPPGLWFNSSEGTSQSSSTPPDHYMLQQHAGMTTTCDPRDVFGRVKPEVLDIASTSESKRNDVQTSSDNERQEPDEDGDGVVERDDYMAHARHSGESSPAEPPTMKATITETHAASQPQPVDVSDDEYEIQETTWHRKGRSSRGKRKNYAEVPLEDIRPHKRQRTSATSSNSRARVYDVDSDDSDEEEPIWVSGRNLRYGETALEVCIPIRRRPFSPSPRPRPRIPRPNLKIILKV